MKPEELKEKISKLKMWQRDGQRAPHKPLLLLYALGRLSRGEPAIMHYEQVKDDLKNLLSKLETKLYKRSLRDPLCLFRQRWYLAN